MILRSILVESWRCFVKPTRVGPFGDGINVVFAPNGTGKSTLFEALRRGLLDNHAVTGHDVEALRPWGRVLAPSVTVEFAHASIEYRFAKRFLDKAASELWRMEAGEWLKLEAGGHADERVRRMLTQRGPGRGLARSEHWGLAQVLWAPQGDLSLPRPSNDVVADIRNALGAQVAGSEGSALERRIEALYLTYFAPVTGRLRTGRDAPAAARTRAQLDEARARYETARAQHEAFSTATRRVDELRAARAHARDASERLGRELDEARRSAEAYLSTARERETHAARASLAHERYRGLHATLERGRRARIDLAEAQRDASSLEAECTVRQREIESLEHTALEAHAALAECTERGLAVAHAERTAERAERFVAASERVASLAARIERATEARRGFDTARAARDALVAPDARALRDARKSAEEARRARERWEEALVTLELTADATSTATVHASEDTRDGTPRGVELIAGCPVRVRGLPEVVVDVPGFGRVRAVGPATSAEALRHERTRTETNHQEILRVFGAADLEALEALGERARALDSAVASAQARLEATLEGGDEPALSRAHTRAIAERDEILCAEPAWSERAPDAFSLRAEATRSRAAFEREAREIRTRNESAEGALTAARSALSVTRARGDEARKRARALAARLDEEGTLPSDSENERALADAALAFDTARIRAEEIEQRLRALGEDPRPRVEQLSTALRAAELAYQTALEQEKSEEGRLSHLSTLGTYSLLAQTEEELQRLESSARDEALRADAVRLLRTVVARCRDEAVAAVATPVQEAATRTLWRIAGEKLGPVRLGDGFEPAGVSPGLADGASVQLEQVSGGEREQIYLATRLALAEVLAREGRQLVVLDDVLTATDAGRLARVLRVLEEKAETLQVLLITCHPERYRGLQGARFFDLEAIARDGA